MVNDMHSSDPSEAKRMAGYYAADQIKEGMIVGLGTGSTVAFTLERIAEKIHAGMSIYGIPTSLQTAMKARALGIPITTMDDVNEIDITIDGADQVDPNLCLIKGRGAAHLRERCIADASKHLIIVVDSSKIYDELSGPVPIEIVPFALSHVMIRLKEMGGEPVIREGVKKDGPVISDNGNIILDCFNLKIEDPLRMQYELNNLPGVVGCGIFAEYGSKTSVIIGEITGLRILGNQL